MCCLYINFGNHLCNWDRYHAIALDSLAVSLILQIHIIYPCIKSKEYHRQQNNWFNTSCFIPPPYILVSLIVHILTEELKRQDWLYLFHLYAMSVCSNVNSGTGKQVEGLQVIQTCKISLEYLTCYRLAFRWGESSYQYTLLLL